MHVQSCCFAYRTPIAEGGERESEDSEDDPIVLINKVTNKYAVALYNFLVHIVNEEKRKASIHGLWIGKQQQQQQN